MREDALARLAVVRRAAAQVAARGDADHHRTGEGVVRAIAQHRHLVAHLHHRRPDVVEELDLDDRLDPAGRHADGAPDDVRLGERRVEHADAAERALQAVRHLEDAAFARDRLQRALARAVRNVLAEDDDPRVPRHFVLERAVDGRDHRVGPAFRHGLRAELARRGIDVRGIDVQLHRIARRLFGGDRLVGRGVDLGVDFATNLFELTFGRDAFRRELESQPHDRIARGLGGPFLRRLVQPFVVRQRMRVRTDDLRVDERRALARARVVDRRRHGVVAGDEVGAVDALDQEAGKAGDDLRDVAAGRLHFDRHRDRVAVVFDQDHDRQLERARGAERFPELAFARRAFADGEVDDLVAVKVLLASFDRRDLLEHPSRFGGANRVQALRAGRARLRDDVEALVAPVRRHLPAAGGRIVLRGDARQQHLERRHAERQAERPVAIVRIEPVVGGLEHHAGGGQDRFVSGAADLEEDEALVLELNFLVVQLPRQHHRAVRAQQLLGRHTVRCHRRPFFDGLSVAHRHPCMSVRRL